MTSNSIAGSILEAPYRRRSLRQKGGEAASSNPADGLNPDEAVWELDDMSECVRPTTEDDTMAPTPVQPEAVKIEKRVAMIRELFAMAGPLPQEPQSLLYQVIIPQRQPRERNADLCARVCTDPC